MTDLTLILPRPVASSGDAAESISDPIAVLHEAGLDVPAGTRIHVAFESSYQTSTASLDDLLHTVGG